MSAPISANNHVSAVVLSHDRNMASAATAILDVPNDPARTAN